MTMSNRTSLTKDNYEQNKFEKKKKKHDKGKIRIRTAQSRIKLEKDN